MKSIIWMLIGVAVWQPLAHAQDVPATIRLGDSCMAMGKYEAAAEYLERAAFFDNARTYGQRIYSALAACYMQQHEVEKALNAADLAYYASKTDSARVEVTLQKVVLLLQAKRSIEAMEEVYAIKNKSALTHSRYHWYVGMVYFHMAQYDSASVHLQQSTQDTALQKAIAQCVNHYQRHEGISPKSARMWSFIIPGSGQLLAGDYQNFANSFLLVGGLMAAFITQSVIATPLDAIYVVGPWLYRYYAGGARMAYDIAARNRANKQAQALQQLLQLFQR